MHTYNIVLMFLLHIPIYHLYLGPQTGSPNFHPSSSSFEVLLFNQRKTDGLECISGSQRIFFSEDATQNTYDCCYDSYNNANNNAYRPDGKLSQFINSPLNAEWNLMVEDKLVDNRQGSIYSWTLHLETVITYTYMYLKLSPMCVYIYQTLTSCIPYAQIQVPCVKAYSWTPLYPSNPPSSRYHALTITYSNYIFIYGIIYYYYNLLINYTI